MGQSPVNLRLDRFNFARSLPGKTTTDRLAQLAFGASLVSV